MTNFILMRFELLTILSSPTKIYVGEHERELYCAVKHVPLFISSSI